jgi:hypothetical protein
VGEKTDTNWMIGSVQKRRSQARKFESPPDFREQMYKNFPVQDYRRSIRGY